MKKIVFITARDADQGFRLTGLNQYAVEDRETAGVLDALIKDQDNGLIIIDERLMGNGVEDRMRELENSWDGILLVLPSPEKLPPEAEDYAARLIRRAIGYHVRLNV